MKYLLALCLFIGFALPAAADPVTVFLIRHADKRKDEGGDPDLSTIGLKRANDLVEKLKDEGITIIYVSKAERTQQTAKPLAKKLKIEPKTQADSTKLAEMIHQQVNKTVLVVGHSDSVPRLIGKLGGPELPNIPEWQYDNLYVLKIDAGGKVEFSAKKYGAPSKPE